MFTSGVISLPRGMAAQVGGHLRGLAGTPTALDAAIHVTRWNLRSAEMPHVLRAVGESVALLDPTLGEGVHRIGERVGQGYYGERLEHAREALATHLDEVDALWRHVGEALARQAARFAEVAAQEEANGDVSVLHTAFAGSVEAVSPEVGAVVEGILEMRGGSVPLVEGADLFFTSEGLVRDIALRLMEQWGLLHRNVLDEQTPPRRFSERTYLRWQLDLFVNAPFGVVEQGAMMAVFQGDPWFGYILRRANAVSWEGVRDVVMGTLQAQLLLQELKGRDPHEAREIERLFEPLSPEDFRRALERRAEQRSLVAESSAVAQP